MWINIVKLLAYLSGANIWHFTYLTRVFHLLHHCIRTWQFVLLILYRSEQHLLHLSVPDVRTCCADQHLQIGRGCQGLSQRCVFDGGYVDQVRGSGFPVYQQSRDGGLGFQWCGSSPVCANVFLWWRQLRGCISGCLPIYAALQMFSKGFKHLVMHIIAKNWLFWSEMSWLLTPDACWWIWVQHLNIKSDMKQILWLLSWKTKTLPSQVHTL